MDVRLEGSCPPEGGPHAARADGEQLERAELTRILGERKDRELLIAGSFVECQGLTDQELEDLYQTTVLALLERRYENEKHVCDGLRIGIKQRALNLHQGERRRAEILAENAPGIHALDTARGAEESAEQIVLAREDRFLITEFMAELTLKERAVFGLVSEGMKYNRIATEEGISVNEARSLVASCERKRERFQLLHDSGRLCGYRSHTIKQLLAGEAESPQLVQLAAAHLQGCPRCRAEYKTNAKRLRRAFEEQAAALLPPSMFSLAGRTRISVHARLGQRIHPDWLTLGQGGARERAVALLAGGGASVKLAAGIATVAVIAGGTITARALEHHPRAARHTAQVTQRANRPVEVTDPAPAAAAPVTLPHASPRVVVARRRSAPGHVVTIAHAASTATSANRREPGGFAYLGVPTSKPAPTPAQPAAQTATATHTGGPFSP
jgi:DNA-directed RNA polymerase specialized sigma24 family protein/predicted anti-sigma-YlaC factor YlaD